MRTTSLTVSDSEQYEGLVTDGRAIVSQRLKNSRFELIVGYGELGQLICNHPLYRKNSKGTGEFLKKLFSDMGVGASSGYYAIQFYLNFLDDKVGATGDVSTVVETLFPEYGDNLSWSKIKGQLAGPDGGKVKHDLIYLKLSKEELRLILWGLGEIKKTVAAEDQSWWESVSDKVSQAFNK